ncbi:glutamine synthetase [Streptoalloteichus tenebrarius]|uniref:Glutamine synthetase n=1 Tax=Streptoalloteichus tenebrarius (strain ATCC 17920 / DSM 40477 / JCM 4838 / CBS 697.72 / NBRC 16177 / NCIMB 11028 / NRRL B-12390 / A12253. 1 / ISP 5477) TaxID=1933 RepID=A0ABT1HN05_STRSD|nr:glutamine synthetase [Streptoalloteichus tenebrarius]MCP2256884.1 glutamine synthetase [Streptoalloteichus tenebrarius]BFF00209.1 gamma-glutamylpolyamine synthetase GlnA3 [Streptoalloteichus tenebrarius]
MTPDRIPAAAEGSEELTEHLRAHGVALVALSFVDNAGVARVKAVPVGGLAAAARYGVGASPCFDTFGFDDVASAARFLGGPDGDLRLVPDPERLAPLACQPGWAWAPVDRYVQEGPRFVGCQRAFAAAQTDAARRRGLRLRMAFEHEWSVGRAEAAPDFAPALDGPAYGLVRLGQAAEHARDLVEALDAQGVTVEQFHPEAGVAQLELSVAPRDPVGAADDVVLVRHTIRRLSAARGWQASFAPCVVPGRVGAGAHLHLSVHDEEGNAFTGGQGRYGLRPWGEAFLAGVLRELPALVAVGAGNPASFLRLQPSRWAGVWQCWGRETRETAMRLVTGTVGTGAWAANAEVKCLDATGNPYLVVGAVVAAGLAGVDDGLRLPAEIHGDPATWSEAARERAGVRRLPTTPGEAVDALAASSVLRRAMGEPLHDAVLAVRRGEAERHADASPADLAALTRWRF